MKDYPGTINSVAEAIASVPDVRIVSAADQPRLLKVTDLVEEMAVFAESRYQAKQTGTPIGPVTGFSTLDRRLGGALAAGVHIIHGGPGVGKTAFALQVAASCGCPSLYITCEMQPVELALRLVARCTVNLLGRLKDGSIPPQIYRELFSRTVEAVPNLCIVDATISSVPIRQAGEGIGILDAARAARGNASDVLIVLDSLHTWVNTAIDEESEYDRLNRGLAELKSLSTMLNCPILCIAERNRMSSEKGGISAGAGSRKIEYCAETMIELDRKVDESPDANSEWGVKVKISKNRNGVTGADIGLKFHGALQRFEEC